MRLKFRILDLIVLTALVALLFGSFREDLTFFRQLLCLEMAAVFSTLGVLLFARRYKSAGIVGAISGSLSGAIFVAATYLLVGQVYEEQNHLHQSIVYDPLYATWYLESGVAWIASVGFGSVIGSLILLRIGGRRLPPDFLKPYRISVGILAVMLLIAILNLLDRFVSFGQGRDLTPLMLVALVAFVIYTHQWLIRFHQNPSHPEGDSERVEQQSGNRMPVAAGEKKS